ncbi:MAG: PKD domain-containing protein, partial [Dehalococcoidia bacterium]|nr:PKD domain-containing protein [Dehalococcoidia bacterium]
ITDTVRWNIVSLAPGASRALTYAVRIPDDYVSGSQGRYIQSGATLTAMEAPTTIGQASTVLVIRNSLANVSVSGPTSGVVGATYPFTATVSPITATLPITYVWQATDQPMITHTGTLIDTASFVWNSPGTKAITVTATNEAGTITGTQIIAIRAKVFLPLVMQSYTGSW